MMSKKINKKIIIIAAGIILLTASLSYAVYAAGVVFFGGTPTQTVVTFTTVGAQTWTVPAGITFVEVLVVAGGGGGASSAASLGGGGGGGAGGLRYLSAFSVTGGQTVNVNVGSGGAPGGTGADQDGGDGTNSSFDTVTATGGGGGGHVGTNGHPGGSGGGGGYNGYYAVRYGGSGVSEQGSAGGNTSLLSWAGGAGGGGAGGVGGDNKTGHAGGDRGAGLSYSITGSPVTYAIGGGGGSNSPASSPANTGKGGDAAYAANTAYAGGTGIVVVRYNTLPKIQGPSIQRGLVGHWALDGDGYNSATGRVTDKTPYGNNGTNYSATLTTDRNGQTNGAMSFDGTSNYVNLGLWNSSLALKALRGDWSYGAWIKTSTDGYIINCTDTGDYVTLSVAGGKAKFLVKDYSPAPEKVASATSVTSVNNNQWHYVAGVWSGDNIYIYVDGVMEGSASGLNAFGNLLMSSWSGSWTVGAQWDSCCSASPPGNRITNRFTGLISDVRIYNRALSVDEIRTLYNSYKPKATSGSLQKGLVLDMPLTSSWTKTVTAGSEIMTDRTPNSNNGQNYGATIGSNSTSFNGSSNYVQPTVAYNPGSGDFTLAAWANRTDLSAKAMISFSSGSYAVGLYSSYIGAGVHFGTGYDGASTVTGQNLSAATWYHVVGTREGTTLKVYVDGVLVGVKTDVPIQNIATSYLQIGRMRAGQHEWYGSLGGIKIYNRALSADEVGSLYVQGVTGFGGAKSYRTSCKEILNAGESTGDGLYVIKPNSERLPFFAYCDMTTDGGGWTLVLSNNKPLTSPTPAWDNAINGININGNLSTNLTTFDLFLGLSYWRNLGSKMRLQIGPAPASLTNKAIYSSFSFSGDNYALYMSGETIVTGSGSPSMYTYHAANHFNLTTSDRDNDAYAPSNCSVSYGNTPWWYGACWDGSFWGYGVAEGARWNGTGDTQQLWGSIWIGQ